MKSDATPRYHWLLLYILVNIIGAVIMLARGELIGDLAGNPLYSEAALLFASFLVVMSYLIMLGPTFSFLAKIKVRQLNFGGDADRSGEYIGRCLLVLQLGFMAFNLATGVNIAGSNTTRSDNPISMLWVLIPPDAMFFIYYGLHRNNRYFYPNMAVWLVSNVMRGWSGMFLFVIFFEWCRAFRKGRISFRMVFLLGIGAILLYPVITNIKWIFRLSATTGLSLDGIAETLATNLTGQDFLTVIGLGMEHIIGRLQVTSPVVEVMRLSDFLQKEFAHGSFTPFWLEGLHGIIVQKRMLGDQFMPIGVAFTKYGDFGWQPEDIGDWNTNIGYAGWFFIAPYMLPLYLLYTVLLGALPLYLVKKLGADETARDMVWLSWLVYLMPPWLSAMVTVIQALLIYVMLRFVFTRPMFR